MQFGIYDYYIYTVPTNMFRPAFRLSSGDLIIQEYKNTNLLYAFFWVIPRRLNFICQSFGRLCSFLFLKIDLLL
jgi:hypothetical protein